MPSNDTPARSRIGLASHSAALLSTYLYQIRRLAVMGSEGKFRDEWENGMSNRTIVWSKTGGHCWYCGIELVHWDHSTKTIAPNTFCVDHVIPKIRGGTSEIDDLLPACWSCNGSKKDATVEEYREALGYKATGAPKFNEEQRDWLEQNGVEIPSPLPIAFWGELLNE